MVEIWNIRVAGYGTFEFSGTESEAEEMRIHKANWERAVAIKWRKDCSTLKDRETALQAYKWDTNKR